MRNTCRGKDGRTIVVRYMEEGLTQTFKAGDLVTEASGYMVAAASDAVALLGVALQDASGTQGTRLPYHPADQIELLLSAQNDTSDGTSARTHLNNDYGINIATGRAYYDYSDTTNKVVRPVSRYMPEAYGTTHGKMWCQIPGSYSEQEDA